MEKKTDLRVVKTKKVLYESLLSLLKEKPFEEIKTSDICDNALINRSTFYSHYADKYELLEDYIQDLKKSLKTELSKNEQITNSKEYYIEVIKILLDEIEKRKDIYLSIMINNKNSITMDMVYDTLDEEIKQRLENEPISKEGIPSNIMSKFYLGGVFNLGIEWLKTNKYTKQQIIDYLELLVPDKIQ